MGSCKLFTKGLLRFLLAVTNIVFFMAGGSALGVGAWFSMDKVFVSDVTGSNLFATASYLMIVCGVCIIIISFVGCTGALIEKKNILLIYIVCVSLVLVVYLSTAIIAAVFQGDLENHLEQNMKTTLTQSYSKDARITYSWDFTQKTLRCCGVGDNGFSLYRQTKFYTNQEDDIMSSKKFVPESCCVYLDHRRRYLNLQDCQSRSIGPPRDISRPDGPTNDALYMTGCVDKAKEFALEYSGIILALGFGFIFVLIAGIVISVCLYRRLQKPFMPVATEETFHM